MNDEEMIRTFKGNLVDYIRKLKETEEKNIQLQSNWNSLREYIGKEWYCFDNESVEFEVAKNILDKMNELEGNDK